MRTEYNIGDIVQTLSGIEAEIEEIRIRKNSTAYRLKGSNRYYTAKSLTLITED